MKKALLMLAWWPLTGWAQDPMSLKDAVHLALNRNKSVEASDASRKAAESRIGEAWSGNLPKVNYSESWTRSDNPVFVFSSLLTQHRFGEQNFQTGPLNRPDDDQVGTPIEVGGPVILHEIVRICGGRR